MSKYLLHCNNKICAHEFYGEEGDKCAWCKEKGKDNGSYILQRLNPPPILQIAADYCEKMENQRTMN